MKWRLVNLILSGDKFSIQLHKLRKCTQKIQSDSSILVHLDYHLIKNNRILGIDIINSKEIFSIITSFKFNIPNIPNLLWKKISSLQFFVERHLSNST